MKEYTALIIFDNNTSKEITGLMWFGGVGGFDESLRGQKPSPDANSVLQALVSRCLWSDSSDNIYYYMKNPDGATTWKYILINGEMFEGERIQTFLNETYKSFQDMKREFEKNATGAALTHLFPLKVVEVPNV